MKKTSYFLLTLVLLLTFVGCNQKGKKLENILIKDGVLSLTKEQWNTIKNVSSTIIELGNPISYSVNIQNNTLIITQRSRTGEVFQKVTNANKQLVKDYFIADLCGESPTMKDLLKQIAETPSASISFEFGDSLENVQFEINVSGEELNTYLEKDYSPLQILKKYVEIGENYWVWNSLFKLSLNEGYVVAENLIPYDSLLAVINEVVSDDIDDAMNSFSANVKGVVDWEKYRSKIVDSYLNNFTKNHKESLIKDGDLSKDTYLLYLIKKADLGLILRYRDETSNRTFDCVFEKDELPNNNRP